MSSTRRLWSSSIALMAIAMAASAVQSGVHGKDPREFTLIRATENNKLSFLVDETGLFGHPFLVAPCCTILRDYLGDIPLLRTMGFLVSQHGQLGAICPPPFLSFSPLESMRSGGPIPPPQSISAILARYHMKTRQMGAMRYYLEKVLRDRGGISHWAAKKPSHPKPPPLTKNDVGLFICVLPRK